ncbi:MAG: DNA polymerase II large subunit, partial [Candidatus Altiarchaeota archaeon]|nr:DNA polymerase II large subunit [Candidatus Altiarchaeota archaeon]
GGRPIFAAPSAKGAFRLRYGRSRSSGIAAKCIHPATMILLDDFIATGTQVKVEKPGKGCVMTECDEIEGPIVRLKDGSVELVETRDHAYRIRDEVEEILFLGDILVSYGDFLQTNTPLLPAGYCEEWWTQEARNAGVEDLKPNSREAVEISVNYSVPLHPRYTYHWEDSSVEELKVLVDWITSGSVDGSLNLLKDRPEAKGTLEILGVPHKVSESNVVVFEYEPLLAQLGIKYEGGFDRSRFDEAAAHINNDSFELVSRASFVKLRRKSGVYIGCRMGRPEKAKERKMQPPVHALFPIGTYGGKNRMINTAVEKSNITIESSVMFCGKCKVRTIFNRCPVCSSKTIALKCCPSCSMITDKDACPRCKTETKYSGKTDVELAKLWRNAIERVGRTANVKGVMGMISEYKTPEPLEKGLLRAINEVYVFKDGTTRFDATDAPLTHFKPMEVGVSVEKLKELGYMTDYLGVELTSEEQVVELKIQDVVIPDSGAIYLIRVSHFVDDLLAKLYNMNRFYNVESKEGLLGHLIIGLAPHTSAGIVGRIVGYTKANVCYAHPFWHAAKRRNCDGDEDAFMLLLDVLLNFSRKYLPEKRGGKMDAPLVISTLLDPKEIDDEAHKMEIIGEYPLEFYDKTWAGVNPGDVNVKVVRSVLESNPYYDLMFTHGTSDVTGPVLKSRYVTLKTMQEKIDAQLKVAEKIRAIEERDVAELVINSHFMRDTYGNLRAFARQHVRCVECNQNYRRPPLSGKCNKCGGKLILTVSEGNIRKYLKTSMNLVEKYHLSDYLKQRLNLVNMEVDSLFTNQLKKQVSLADYM